MPGKCDSDCLSHSDAFDVASIYGKAQSRLRGDVMKIDVHCHFYPDVFLRELEEKGPISNVRIERDEWGRIVLVQNGALVVTVTAAMTNIELRLEEMGRAGIDLQVLSLWVPGVTVS